MSQEPSGTAGVPPARRDSRGGSRGGSSAPPSRRWIWISLVLVLVLGTAAYFGARPAWRAVKVARAKSFLRETDAMVAKEDWTLAFQRSRSAQQLAPFHPEVVRHSAQLHARFGLETGLRFYEQLLAMPAATDSDRLGYVELALKLGAMESAWSQLDDLLAAPAPHPHALVLGAQYFAFRRNPLRALALARSAVAAEPNNPTNAMALAVLLGASRNAADKAEATRMLMPVAAASGPLQLRALSALLSMPEVARGDRERATGVLEAMPQRGQEAELLWYDARIALDVTLRPRLADEAVDRWARGTPLELAQLGGWLNRHGLFQRTLDLVLADAALAQEALFRVRYDALVGAGAIRDAYEFVLLDRVPGDPMLVEQLRVATAARLRDTKAVQSHLRAMLDATKGNPRQLRIVADVAQRYQQRGIADEAHRVLSRNKREAVPAFQALMRSADQQGETWVARDYARKLLTLRKEDDVLRMQIAYYDLLLQENTEAAHAEAVALHRAKPEDFNRRAVLALSHLRRNEPQLASDLIEGQTVTWGRLPPGVRAVCAAVLGSTRREAGAAKLLQRTPMALLKAEERELVRGILAQIPAPELRESPPNEAPEKL